MCLFLSTKPLESTNIEEEEVCKMIRECLNLRKKYVYREKVAPWKAEPLAKNSDPYHFDPVERSSVCLLLVHYGSVLDKFCCQLNPYVK